ncbi:helix-turn-helix domain-containing protein [Conexibacter sp. JD483]|uniref:TetR/AcrR family transcriptional regulator n=1 Tax=unclassified Conexibacter TaxID=2627773 RepID=UPI0027195285|nr:MULTISPECIES: TetR/AcrR family transcriptional regulator [unclassified Conexibacter]MDO8185654.1 helix-turn-helix domain-containing protein [Conexibacter sp. CPCC 205706]MDO8198827.1 helix-turn-helix domain-containing protein [Conexibacter sp. CPCC 205762]MDR9367823.1 helix-turn-helix domain-containing protein [Conexibacter sp. JD483]
MAKAAKASDGGDAARAGDERLDREAWIAAGLDALEEGGTDAVSASALAKRLGVTRGSFYWHFASRDELLRAVLERWERDHSDAVLDALAAVADPRERLRLLLDAATSKPPSLFIRLLAAQTREPLAAEILNRSRGRRVDFLARAFRDTGLAPAAARRRALAVYAAYVGLAQLVSADETLLAGRERSAFARELAAMLVPPHAP